MKIDEKKLRQIIRQELNEAGPYKTPERDELQAYRSELTRMSSYLENMASAIQHDKAGFHKPSLLQPIKEAEQAIDRLRSVLFEMQDA
jgi:hypothetical protein